ncbi:hypothetical protein F5Y18DRAFT_424759 [Xylariaceae sp. FL1019]|nr:hypothetical protein F5Y18DRAFT_424759 [Xylariaceae sp. FL1019]
MPAVSASTISPLSPLSVSATSPRGATAGAAIIRREPGRGRLYADPVMEEREPGAAVPRVHSPNCLCAARVLAQRRICGVALSLQRADYPVMMEPDRTAVYTEMPVAARVNGRGQDVRLATVMLHDELNLLMAIVPTSRSTSPSSRGCVTMHRDEMDSGSSFKADGVFEYESLPVSQSRFLSVIFPHLSILTPAVVAR